MIEPPSDRKHSVASRYAAFLEGKTCKIHSDMIPSNSCYREANNGILEIIQIFPNGARTRNGMNEQKDTLQVMYNLDTLIPSWKH